LFDKIGEERSERREGCERESNRGVETELEGESVKAIYSDKLSESVSVSESESEKGDEGEVPKEESGEEIGEDSGDEISEFDVDWKGVEEVVE